MELLFLEDDIPDLGGPNPREKPPKKLGSPELLRRLHGVVYDDDSDNIFNDSYVNKPFWVPTSSSSSKRPMTLPNEIPKVTRYHPSQKEVRVKSDRFISGVEPQVHRPHTQTQSVPKKPSSTQRKPRSPKKTTRKRTQREYIIID